MADCDCFTAVLPSRSRAQGCMWVFVWEMVLIRAKRRYIYFGAASKMSELCTALPLTLSACWGSSKGNIGQDHSLWRVRDDPRALAWTLASLDELKEILCASMLIWSFWSLKTSSLRPETPYAVNNQYITAVIAFLGSITSQGNEPNCLWAAGVIRNKRCCGHVGGIQMGKINLACLR